MFQYVLYASICLMKTLMPVMQMLLFKLYVPNIYKYYTSAHMYNANSTCQLRYIHMFVCLYLGHMTQVNVSEFFH